MWDFYWQCETLGFVIGVIQFSELKDTEFNHLS